MKTLSAQTYASPYVETMAFADITGQTVDSLEEAFQNNFLGLRVPENRFTPEDILKGGPLVEVVAADPVMSFMAAEMAAFRERRRLADARWVQKSTLHTNFGRWLQKDEKAIVAAAKEGLETLEDRLSVLPYIVEKIRSRKAWKAEQSAAQAPQNYADTSLDYDLPPATKGRSHAPAYYSITGPSGRTINLSQPHGSFKPVLSSNPNDAFRRFITRLGVDRKGGETELLNLLLKADMVQWTNANGERVSDYKWLPSYVSSFQDNAWFVVVGWKLNPKCQFGSFHREGADGYVMPFIENAAGELEPFIPGVHSEDDILTTSQLDYKLLCEDSGMAIVDKNEEVVDYMNESEELVAQGMIRDDDHADEEVDNFLLVQAASEMDRMIDLRTGSAVWLLDGFEDQVFEHTRKVGAECHELKKQIKAFEAKIGKYAFEIAAGITIDDDDNAMGKLLAQQLSTLKWKLGNARANYRLASEDLRSQTNQSLWMDRHARECIGTPRSSAPDAFNAPMPATVNVFGGHPMAGSNLTLIPGASNEPRNQVVLAAPKINEVGRIVPTVNPLTLLQNGLTRLCVTPAGTVSTRLVQRAKTVHTTPQNANPRLQHTLMRLTLGLAPV